MNIKSWRKHRAYTQKKLAEWLGMEIRGLQDAENKPEARRSLQLACYFIELMETERPEKALGMLRKHRNTWRKKRV